MKYLKNLIAAILGIEMPRTLVMGEEPSVAAYQFGHSIDKEGKVAGYIAFGHYDPENHEEIYTEGYARFSSLYIQFNTPESIDRLVSCLERTKEVLVEKQNENNPKIQEE